ncbi:Protein kinase, ATP binding site,Protein kinase domain,Serine/threonine-protein kinase, active site,GS [Cinara cedri]|uniref:receptor protein serine/threonine kinase n=1 Tax=Cinara cedri TaxID=506608 RepID=A0A5E4MX60_9HEMI|nr:Protein kinase, ATP binding site,Protein kinase domain,Serine/threonine-protein kinase, active site,GS [Cinara cedri]
MDIVCHLCRRKYILNSMTLEMSLLLVSILLAVSTTKALPTKDPVTMLDFGSGLKIAQPKELDSKAPHGKLTTKEMFENMMQAENELGLSDDDNDYEDEKHSEGASLLSAMPSDNSGGQKNHFKCMSCSGLLPLSWDDEQDFQVNEQLYCFPDGALMPQPDETRKNENEERDSVCSGAIRCWKAKVREYDGRVRISRGCVGSGKESDQKTLNLCMGSVSVVSSNNETKKNDSQLPYTVWTSSHTYSSATFGVEQQSQPSLPPSYAIECCAGQDLCNDGPFPLLPKLALAGWRWTPISKKVVLLAVFFMAVATIAALVFFRKAGKMKKTKHRQRNKGGVRKNKRRKRTDRDRKTNRHLSFSSMSTSSTSSISSGGQSSSCEGKRSRSRGRRKRHTTTLTMVDLLEGVVVATESGTDIDDSPQPSSFTSGYSPAAITESTVDGDFLPPPYNSRQQEDDWTSGSGYGLPVLVQRTLAKQIQLQQLVGKGRYGEVWRATYWNGGHEHVAVKIFLSKDEPSWKRETEIYSTVLMRHDNILGFIGSDIMTSRNSYTTQLLLITHYHRYGSLYDFLQTPMASDPTCTSYDFSTIINDTTVEQSQQTDRDRPPLTMNQMLNVLYTVASGLCHLHTEIFGTQGKPGIAHRDIKSKNVLVKCARTGACCVADFGMAVTSLDAGLPIQTTTAAVGDNSQNTRVGTKRYMAPEVLDDSISSAAALALASTVTEKSGMSSSSETTSSVYWCFDAYRRGDVYSYALVMWEVLSRTLISYGPAVTGQDLKVDKEKQIQLPSGTENCYNPYVYRAPYQDRGAGWDPGFDDMRRIVCSPDPVLSRPGVASEWLADPIMNAVVETMRECWHSNPNARLPSLRVKKKLFKLIHELVEREHQYNSETEQPIPVTE